MSKREMAAWYWAICEAMKETPYWAADGDEALECHEAFFAEWCRLLFVEAGRPTDFRGAWTDRTKAFVQRRFGMACYHVGPCGTQCEGYIPSSYAPIPEDPRAIAVIASMQQEIDRLRQTLETVTRCNCPGPCNAHGCILKENWALKAEIERLIGVNKAQGERHAKRCEEWAKTADQEREAKESAILQVGELREALYALLKHATKPQPRDEEEQEQVVAKVAKALKSAGKLDESEGTVNRKEVRAPIPFNLKIVPPEPDVEKRLDDPHPEATEAYEELKKALIKPGACNYRHIESDWIETDQGTVCKRCGVSYFVPGV